MAAQDPKELQTYLTFLHLTIHVQCQCSVPLQEVVCLICSKAECCHWQKGIQHYPRIYKGHYKDESSMNNHRFCRNVQNWHFYLAIGFLVVSYHIEVWFYFSMTSNSEIFPATPIQWRWMEFHSLENPTMHEAEHWYWQIQQIPWLPSMKIKLYLHMATTVWLRLW